MAKSDSILGRKANQIAFERGRPFSVAAYFTRRARVRFSDAGHVPWIGNPTSRTLYRINVKPRNGAQL